MINMLDDYEELMEHIYYIFRAFCVIYDCIDDAMYKDEYEEAKRYVIEYEAEHGGHTF